MKKLFTGIVAAVFIICGVSVNAQAALSLWGNNASGSLAIENFDLNIPAGTAAETLEYNPMSGNGRGIVVVGDTVYYTRVGDNNIYKLSALTGASLGSISTTQASMSTIAWDGSTFWTTDYAGSNKAFQIAADGSLLKTISLSLATGYSDGMEYFNGKLIANRTDGGFGGSIIYDIYDLDGNVLTSNFISSPNGTGIAFDGKDFIVSDIYNSQVHVYDGTTGAFIKTIVLPGTASTGYGRIIEDLSVDYALREDTGGGPVVPEPASMLLLSSGLLGMAGIRRKNA